MEELLIQQAPAGRGSAWLSGGFDLFRKAPGVWIGTLLAMLVIQIVLGVIPYIGSIAGAVLGPVLQAGWLLACRKLHEGDEFRFGDLFGGFSSPRFGQLAMTGVFYLLGLAVIGAVVGGMFAAFFPGAKNGGPQFGVRLMLLIAVAVTMGGALLMAIAFAPALVLFRNQPAFAALKASLRACWVNMWPLFIYGLLMLLVVMIAAIPFGLGLLVALPVMIASSYVTYEELFPENDGGDQAA